MRGSCFIKPFELIITTEQESWEQGGEISGHLEIKGDGDQGEIRVVLAYGTFKKVRKQTEDAFTAPISINLGADGKFSTLLTIDAAITDKSGSLYLLYGVGDDLSKFGQLQLQVDAAAPLITFQKILVDFFRFRVAQTKFNKGYVEIKLAPPGTKEFVTLDALTCLLRMDGDDLEIKYTFKVRTLDMASGKMQVEQKAKKFESRLNPKEYLLHGAPNYDIIKGEIKQIFKQVIKGQFLMGQL
jgi:hypothetical protein